MFFSLYLIPVYNNKISKIMEDNTLAKEVRFSLTDDSVSFLKEGAKWAKFLAIMGFIGVGFMFMGGFYMGFFMSNLSGMYGNTLNYPPGFWWIMAFVYWVLAAIYIAPVYYLFQFSDKMISAINSLNNQKLNDSFKYLKSHYKFLGIMTIVILSLYALFIVIAIIAVIVFAAHFV